MQNNITNTNKKSVSQGHSEISSQYSKRQKIVAALHLVTSHLPAHEPFRTSVRSYAMQLCESHTHSDSDRLVRQLCELLDIGTLGSLISKGNSHIIKKEVMALTHTQREEVGDEIVSLFGQTYSDTHETQKRHTPSFSGTLSQEQLGHPFSMKKTSILQTQITDIHERRDISELKKERKQKILDYINSKRTAVIKDIISLFPEVSEKTIQRELNVLLEEGKIEKRGDKRWSLYVSKITPPTLS